MKVWGYLDALEKVEFISYRPEYYCDVIDVIRDTFFKFETVSISSEISSNEEAQNDLCGLCEDVLKKSGVSIIARDVEKDKIVGVALNVVQVKTPSYGGPSYFEAFRDESCKTENAKCLMNYMIEADSKVDIFERFNVESLLEIMFLAVRPEYGRRSIGYELCKYSVDLARDLKNGKDVETYLSKEEPRPQLVSALWTGRKSQSIGQKLGFEVVFQEPFSKFAFKGKTFSERVGDLSLFYHVAAKRI